MEKTIDQDSLRAAQRRPRVFGYAFLHPSEGERVLWRPEELVRRPVFTAPRSREAPDEALRRAAEVAYKGRVQGTRVESVQSGPPSWAGIGKVRPNLAMRLAINRRGNLEVSLSGATGKHQSVLTGQLPQYAWWDLLKARTKKLEPVSPEEIGALTSDPFMVSDEICRGDDRRITAVGRVFSYRSYQVHCPIEQLLDGETVTLEAY